ncbi:hypothetical protein Poly24_13820 [Rosistilla carotiformis]|uniref:Uncharacterized protein n=1 Tax=Rosistilla carotiformis TaxID=2528017 RepID=A0A518JQ57_9BACT|nr:hypothetical protein [Rosistilla carotiformis]QDV67680.1 hypothetical protein Poly24_13820 [Rosistilla carotiformis]
MYDFRPIDHKDSDAEYAALVRGDVAKKAGCDLLDTVDSAALVGRWRSSLDYRHTELFDYDFRADGTYSMPTSFSGPTPNTWRIDGDHFIDHSWCPPAPEYDIHEPMDNIETYRCAQLTDGRFAYWNGDGSLLVFLTQIIG